MKHSTPITEAALAQYGEAYKANRPMRIMSNAMSKTAINQIVYDTAGSADKTFKFSIDIETMPITNQRASGRCWIFAGLNVLREVIAKKHNIEQFELSQNYVAFWDKYEKINYFIDSIIDTADRDVDDRTVSWILSTGIQDGGQWDMFVNVVNKYGLVAQDAMPETFQSNNTGAMNGIINIKLRKYAYELREMYRAGATAEALVAKKNEYLNEMYGFMVACCGVPPTTFDFEYVDKDKAYHIQKGCTPMGFYKEYFGDTLGDYISIINATTNDKPFNNAFTVKYLGNVVGGTPIRYINVDIQTLKNLVVKQLKDGEIVWFGSDVGKFGDREKGVWDDQSYGYELAFGMDLTLTKEQELDYRNGCMNHAMAITGVNLDDDVPNRWKIENSWGDTNGKKGYYLMSDTWFDRFTYQAVVHKKYLDESLKPLLTADCIELNPWDPMGSLAE